VPWVAAGLDHGNIDATTSQVFRCELGESLTDAPPLVVGIDSDDLDDAHALVEGIQRHGDEADRSSAGNSAALLRRLGRRSARKAKYVAGRAEGVAAQAARVVSRPAEDADDATVKDRILSQAFREAVAITSATSTATIPVSMPLRGTLDSVDLDLVERVRAVPGVRT
jgi:hypothetical protein